MKFVNNSKHYVRAYVYSGFPVNEKNLVTTFVDYPPEHTGSHDLDPGDYYIHITTTNIGPNLPGLVIAASGGVSSGGTVTLISSDRISVT